jgi:hypothetical protein
MLLEVLLHFSSKTCISSLYEIARVPHSNDDYGIIQSTGLEKKIQLACVSLLGQFIVMAKKVENDRMEMSFGVS